MEKKRPTYNLKMTLWYKVHYNSLLGPLLSKTGLAKRDARMTLSKKITTTTLQGRGSKTFAAGREIKLSKA